MVTILCQKPCAHLVGTVQRCCFKVNSRFSKFLAFHLKIQNVSSHTITVIPVTITVILVPLSKLQCLCCSITLYCLPPCLNFLFLIFYITHYNILFLLFGTTAYSQEHLKSFIYWKFGRQAECISMRVPKYSVEQTSIVINHCLIFLIKPVTSCSVFLRLNNCFNDESLL